MRLQYLTIIILLALSSCFDKPSETEKAIRKQKQVYRNQLKYYKSYNLSQINKINASGDTLFTSKEDFQTEKSNLLSFIMGYNEAFNCHDIRIEKEPKEMTPPQPIPNGRSYFNNEGGVLTGNLLYTDDMIKQMKSKSREEKCSSCQQLIRDFSMDINKNWNDTTIDLSIRGKKSFYIYKDNILNLLYRSGCTKL